MAFESHLPSDIKSSNNSRRTVCLGDSTDILSLSAGVTLLTVLWGDRKGEASPHASGVLKVSALRSPLLGNLVAFICSVGGHFWPLGMDCTVVHVGPRRFCFSLPGLLLGLTLPEECPADELQSFGHLMSTCCMYENRAGNTDADFCTQEPGKDFWESAYTNIAAAIGAITGEAEALLPKRVPESASERERRRKERQMKARAASFSNMTATLKTMILNGILVRRLVRVEGTPSTAALPPIASIRMVTDLVDMVDEIKHSLFPGIPLDHINRRFPPATPPYWVWGSSGRSR